MRSMTSAPMGQGALSRTILVLIRSQSKCIDPQSHRRGLRGLNPQPCNRPARPINLIFLWFAILTGLMCDFPEDRTMNRGELARVAGAMVAKNRGILAADESSGTIKKRFDSIRLES